MVSENVSGSVGELGRCGTSGASSSTNARDEDGPSRRRHAVAARHPSRRQHLSASHDERVQDVRAKAAAARPAQPEPGVSDGKRPYRDHLLRQPRRVRCAMPLGRKGASLVHHAHALRISSKHVRVMRGISYSRGDSSLTREKHQQCAVYFASLM